MTRAPFGICIAIALATSAAPAAHAQRMGSRLNLSAAAGVNVPIGDLDKQGQTGFGIAVRTESGDSSEPWTYRGGITFDRFGGKGGLVDNYQYTTFVTELVHHTNKKAYQYVGIGFYQSKIVFVSTSTTGGMTNAATGTQARTESDFGFQGGVGLNFGKNAKTFLEIGMVDVLSTGRTSVWFPVRVGIRL